MDAVAVILGSAFGLPQASALQLQPRTVQTPFGPQEVYQLPGRPAYAIYRHGLPHRLLPQEINYRAQAWALKELACGALLTTSSVGVLDRSIPLYQPLRVADLIMPENRLPDGSLCTMFHGDMPGKGHLVLDEGLVSKALSGQITALAQEERCPTLRDVVFAYAPGPRGKTAAENRLWAQWGAQVNSMTLAPEVVLANELEIPCAALVVGHKYSLPSPAPADTPPVSIADSLVRSADAIQRIVARFLKEGEPAPFANHIFRFSDHPDP